MARDEGASWFTGYPRAANARGCGQLGSAWLLSIAPLRHSRVVAGQMLPVIHAVRMPPHARVNSQCYMKWNADRSDLEVVWRGTIHSHGFHAFNDEPDGREETCFTEDCVQRLWCTDSGVAGWYGNEC